MSKKIKTRIIFLLVFVMLYSLATILSVLMAISTGLVPDPEDPPPTSFQLVIAPIGEAMANIFLGPIMLVHDAFFMGHSLPLNDWVWIIGLASIYGFIFLFAWEKFSRWRK